MANNRVFIACRVCEDSRSLMKFYPSSGWAMSCSEKVMEEFIAAHERCWEYLDPEWGDVWYFETAVSMMEPIDE